MDVWLLLCVMLVLSVLSGLIRKLSGKRGGPRRRSGGRGITATGKIRATTSDGDGERGSGPDYSVLKIEDVSKSAKKVYLYLSAIADAEGCCFPFHKTIAERTGLSTTTVVRAVKELEERGLLSHQQRVSRRGGSSNLYRIERAEIE